jgi:hypothetical protein
MVFSDESGGVKGIIAPVVNIPPVVIDAGNGHINHGMFKPLRLGIEVIDAKAIYFKPNVVFRDR